jgi:inner membrane protein
MSPVTHLLAGWALANSAGLERRDRLLVTLLVVVPSIDGLGIVAEVLTRNLQHPLLWFSRYHHTLHSLVFALVITTVAFALSEQKWKTGSLISIRIPLPALPTSEWNSRYQVCE